MVMMMMDLNMSSASEEEESSASAAAAAEKSTVDDSGSSISSEDCRYLGFRFGILKEQRVEETSMSLFTTRQLFPMEIGIGSSSSTSSAIDFGRGVKPQDMVQLVNSQQQQLQQPPQQPKKVRRGPRSRSSQYRGVTFYRRTGRWESHIWDCGKQVYLGGFDTADAAARAYDRAAIKFRGVEADINFTLSDYKDDLMQSRNLTKEEFVHALRRQSTGFARGTSKYRGVMRPHKCGRLEDQTGQLLGNKYIYLGLSDKKIEATRAYDKATIKYDGREAVVSSELISLPEVAIEAIGHDLDLNLRISQPDNTIPKRRNNPMGIQVHFGSFEHSDAKKARINNASIAGGQSHGLAMAPEPPQAWSALYPGLFPRTEGKSSREKT